MSDELSPEARATLQAARSAEPRPTSGDKARVRALIGAAIVAPALAPAPAHAAGGASGASGAGGAVGVKVAGALLAVGIGAGAFWAAREESRPVAPPAVQVRGPVPVVPDVPVAPVAPVAPPVEVEVEVAPQLPPARAPAASPSRERGIEQPPVRAASQLAEETALIRAAKSALREGDTAAALARVAEHRARFAAGELSEERTAVEAMALCRAGRAVEGRAAQEQLAADSAYRAAVEQECE